MHRLSALVLTLAATALNAPTAPTPTNAGPTDLLVTATGDTTGYHVYTQEPAQPWRELATLRPDLPTEDAWTGRQCVTGDGRSIVAVVAPRGAVNRPDQFGHGGLAYAIDVRTGAVRPLAAAVSLSYFTPACGTGSLVALTRYRTIDAAGTDVLVVDAADGATRQHVTDDGELTSAVPVGDGIVAADGGRLIRITQHARTTVASLPGQAYDLHPNAEGGVDLLTAQAGTAVAWRWVPAAAPRRLGSGPLSSHVYGGSSGQTAIAGVTRSVGDVKGLHWLPGPAPAAVSTTLSRPLGTPAAVPAPRPTTALTPLPSSLGKAAQTTTPTCAVPRNDVRRQVRQPGGDQINWAIDQAARGWLTTSRSGEPSWGLTPYKPNNDFPLPALRGAGSVNAVPEEVIDAVAAQESNWNQASWHALPGMPGNPLVADYYGLSADGNSFDYANADCGYGLTQRTDGMRLDTPGLPANTQLAVGLDYAENIAAGVAVLAAKWNQLAAAGITMNTNDPLKLENWYFALWAYNSGINPQASTGNTSGCTPGPSCTDGSGNWGLGWANNPANPVYPPNRAPYLRTTYADAAHPGDWPYQERVIGWMETPLRGPDGVTLYVPSAAQLLIPGFTTFCTAQNSCDPATSGHCTRSDLHCWWHWPVVTSPSCAGCVNGSYPTGHGSEPSGPVTPHPAVCSIVGTGLGSALIVDEQATGSGSPDINLLGCPSTPSGWSNKGAFTASFGTVGMVDYHQIGGGFGGRLTFTHQVATGDAAHTVTGTWRPQLANRGIYEIKVFVPDIGATAVANYRVLVGTGRGTYTAKIDQSQVSGWVSIGRYALTSGAQVSLTNATGVNGADLAFDAVAFVPVQNDTHTWVAMGDSYSSGQGATPYDDGTDTSGPPENRCKRSPDAYPRVANQRTTGYSGQLVHVACGGDTTDQILNSRRWNEPAQAALLSDHTSLVTVTMGGNDLNFTAVVNDCVTNGNCSSNAQWNDLDARIDALRAPLAADYKQIRAAAPNATVAVLTYPQVFPANSSDCDQTPPPLFKMTKADVTWAHDKLVHLDQVIRGAVADAADPKVVLVDMETAFAGHDVCASDHWVNQVAPLNPDETLHPNASGYSREADLLIAALHLS